MDAETATYWLGWVKFGQLVAFFLVAIGVAAEFAGEWASRPLEKIIDDARELEMEHLKRVTTPRVNFLTPEALTSIIEKIKPFHGTKFDIGHAQTGHEQWDFLWQLEPIFPKAGWEFVNWVGPQTFNKSNWTMQPHVYGIAKVANVVIELDPEKRAELLPAATALAEALNDVGLTARVANHPIGGTSTTSDAIHILVGIKE